MQAQNGESALMQPTELQHIPPPPPRHAPLGIPHAIAPYHPAQHIINYFFLFIILFLYFFIYIFFVILYFYYFV